MKNVLSPKDKKEVGQMKRFCALALLLAILCSFLSSCDLLVPVMTNPGTKITYQGLDPSTASDPVLSDMIFRAASNDYSGTGLGYAVSRDAEGVFRADPLFPDDASVERWNSVIAPGLTELRGSAAEKKLDFVLSGVWKYTQISALFMLYENDGWQLKTTAECYWDGSKIVSFTDLFEFDDYRKYLADFITEQTGDLLDAAKLEAFKNGLMSFDSFTVTEDGVKVTLSDADVLVSGREGELLIPKDYFDGTIVQKYTKRWAEYKPVTDPNEKVIAITFDDGPTSKFTPYIADLLEKYQVKVTFFMVGHRLNSMGESTRQKVLSRLVEDGSQIANHSYNHPNYNTMSFNEIMKELNDTSELIKDAIGFYPTCMRPPYGNLDKSHVGKIGLFCILWSVDTLDWKDRDSGILKEKVLNDPGVRSGDIVLMHEIHESTVNAFEDIIVGLLDQGFRFVTVEELYDLRGKEVDARKYFSLKSITSYD